MKKIILLPVFSIVIGLGACKKENVLIPEQNSESTSIDHQQRTGNLTVDFGYKLYTVANNDGSTDYRCLKPKDDCSKVKSVATSTRNTQEVELDHCISNHSESTFFATQSNWDELLPNLADQTDWLGKLTSGELRLLKKTDSEDGGILYLAYDSEVDPAEVKASDISFAIGVTDAEE